ncbi:L-2-amino-thiazoline-4-carboxylic acid hydrolase [Clostridium sp. PL3]|uniref:L-2-amino-thiazoline-4-carboxylic acid hydrolase n=1 Tax=Clostridium thailandense TaxID=2794346 RepID=A0A949U071_9CLOT|nr:L-2-amino-thiazoline-4-carboxylic acid hydrolase [Clostridium thailandense]MBV7275903.1 L-2-amino-thiazoline-4-carboxylic acid hydrolase [Clostridium thailandense]
MIDNKITIKGDLVADIQRGAIGHRATWTGLTYTKAREAGKAEEVEKFIREAISETGLVQGTEIKSNCQNPESVKCFAETFLTSNVAKTFELEFKTKTEDRVDIEFHHCPLLKAWQDLGFDDATCEKLCDMAMDGDRGIAKAMGFEFHLGDTIAKGCKTCQVSFFKAGK